MVTLIFVILSFWQAIFENEIINGLSPLLNVITCPGLCQQGKWSAIWSRLQSALFPIQGYSLNPLCKEREIIERENNWDNFPHTRAHARTHANTDLMLLQGGCLKHLFSLMRDMSLTCVSDAQHGKNTVGFNSINLLHLSLYHINTSQLSWMR